ncbi:cysteate racemase [Advenella mimigardefordensis]|uniref:Aspartate racemase n=1 Tax=Advenella mimigardefordensis (strain DSM 17166 / LMG 22922 / DPN7) TaxID=1247726 RepID=W0PB51_ADVMD|nr:amino acid racemase [Advenella mimigardefordensis]AHG62697.1 aspartate racemase [Advenella mimigardefordensis DPN7]
MSSLDSTTFSTSPAAAPAAWPVLGVLGGMGPLAGATFAARLVQLTPVTADQAHIPVLLRNDPRIPDRSSAQLAGGPSPLPAMREGMQDLQRWGAQCIAIPCNTAHLWFEQLRDSVQVPVLHIVESVIQDLRRNGIFDGPVGVMGTPATMQLGLYQDALRAAGYEPFTGNDNRIRDWSVQAIAAVKANQNELAFAPAASAVNQLTQMGARAVILGCTELPLAIPPSRRGEFDVVISDSIDALALAVLDAFSQQGQLQANPDTNTDQPAA